MNPITVSTLTTHIVTLFEGDELLRDLTVIGEISNWKRAASGHCYFSLKDSGATIAAVLWRGSALNHPWLPGDGDAVIAHGYVGVYPERGAYQLYVNRLLPAGRGQFYARFEALKEKLAAAGLFDRERKRPLAASPRRIGVVTSADAAALRDILRVLAARWPLVDVVVFPTLVQGAEAPAQIAAALAAANRYSAAVEPLDTLILARGGGSIEDLWAFNDESVAYAVAASALPVICGVGHEVDFTIADFVADQRAPTPSAAAAAAVPDRSEAHAELTGIRSWLAGEAERRLAAERRELEGLALRLRRQHPQRTLDLRQQRLTDRSERLHRALQRRIERLIERSGAGRQRLQALSPLDVLRRGYSIVQNADGRVLTAPGESRPGERLSVRAAGGSYTVTRHSDVGTRER